MWEGKQRTKEESSTFKKIRHPILRKTCKEGSSPIKCIRQIQESGLLSKFAISFFFKNFNFSSW